MSDSSSSKKRPVTIFLSQEDYDHLSVICKARQQSRADFLRAAISVHGSVPNLNTRPLAGACLKKHLDRLKREKRMQSHKKRKEEE